MDSQQLYALISKGLELLPKDIPSKELNSEQLEKVQGYQDLLVSWNERMDLIAPAELEQVADRHICDSILSSSIMCSLGEPTACRALDVGSGAGLPGVLTAICWPNWQVILCEPREKRTVFLKEVRRRLELDNMEVARGRLEELKLDEEVDLIFSRALGRPELLMQHSGGLLKRGGVIAELVSANWEESPLSDSFSFLGINNYTLPLSGVSRGIASWSFDRS